MAMFPSLMHDSLFGDLFDDPFFTGLRRVSDTPGTVVSGSMMNTDVRETDKGYAVDIDMPGFKKEDIAVELKNGYLTVSAHRDTHHDEKNDNGCWLRRERYVGSCSRSFYVGENVKDTDIHASYKDGTLCLELPKPEARQQVEQKHTIAIEG